MEGRLKEAGFEMVPFGDQADLGIINTCTVTNEADAKSRNTIRRFIRSNPLATVVVVGCYSQVSANEVASIKGVDYIIGNHDKLNLLEKTTTIYIYIYIIYIILENINLVLLKRQYRKNRA